VQESTTVLKGKELQALNDALGDAFNPDTFQQMLMYYTDRELENYASKWDTMPTITFRVTTAAQAEGWLPELINAARQSRPRSEQFAAFAERIGISSLSPAFEAKIRQDLTYIEIAPFLEELTAIESRVCKVEIAESGSGTGFLVGPDVAMTNHHVLAGVIDGARKSEHVVLRFDYRKAADGSELPGKEFGLAKSDEWLLDASPPFPVDTALSPSANGKYLDYALVRVEGQPGNDQVRIDASGSGVSRGWIGLPDPVPELRADAPLFIVQHPEGASLKLALESKSILGLVEEGTRVRHRTNTDPGSSGSPCFNEGWKLVALHCAGDRAANPQWNEAVPIAEIGKQLEQRGKTALLSAS
jgi:hypothetical protein